MPAIAIEGTRSVHPNLAPLVSQIARQSAHLGYQVITGCCSGTDALVRSALAGSPLLRVFSIASGQFGVGRSAFARRTIAIVRAAQAAGKGSRLTVFLSRPCPAGLLPSPSPSACFRGLGSGSWAAAAFAVGLGLPVSAFWVGPGTAQLPASWGSWAPCGQRFRLVPHRARQLSLSV